MARTVRPVHITFTGLEASAPAADVLALSRDYPIEWGILFHPTRQGFGRFPAIGEIEPFLALDLRLSAHLCGGYARDVVEGAGAPIAAAAQLHRFVRIQINTSQRGVRPAVVAEFARSFGARGILQCRGFERFPENTTVDWLFDRSGGQGRLADRWPVPSARETFVGYSGGLGPDTIDAALVAIARSHPEHIPFWIDMESAIRTDDKFDLAKCRRVCDIVYRASN
ncbi:MAG: hypothetical protein ACLPKB_07650 [Xanthobacteraceae bacterium]